MTVLVIQSCKFKNVYERLLKCSDHIGPFRNNFMLFMTLALILCSINVVHNFSVVEKIQDKKSRRI